MPQEKYRSHYVQEYPSLDEFKDLESFEEFVVMINREDLEDYAIVLFDLVRGLVDTGIV